MKSLIIFSYVIFFMMNVLRVFIHCIVVVSFVAADVKHDVTLIVVVVAPLWW